MTVLSIKKNEIIVRQDFKKIIPPLTQEEYDSLEKSLKNEGCRDALVVWNNVLIDGHNRYEICLRHHISFQTIDMQFDNENEAKLWIIQNQLSRRDLDKYQRMDLALQFEDIYRAMAKGNKQAAIVEARSSNPNNKNEQFSPTLAKTVKNIDTREEISKMADVSHGTLDKYKKIKQQSPEQVEKLKKGETTVNKAYNDIVREGKRVEVIEKLKQIESNAVKPIDEKYDVIVIDPPWPMMKIERDVRQNQAGFDYPTMTIEEIIKLEIPAAKDCHLWIWTTTKYLPVAFRILDAWDFKYVYAFVWHKAGGFQPFNLPQFNCEFALYARKGNPIFLETKAFPLCFSAERGRHSEKPRFFL